MAIYGAVVRRLICIDEYIERTYTYVTLYSRQLEVQASQEISLTIILSQAATFFSNWVVTHCIFLNSTLD